MLIINQMIGYSIWLFSSPILVDPSHKSHNVLYKYLTISHFVTKLCTTLAHFFYKMMYCVIWGITTTRSAAVAAMTPSPPSWSLFLYSLFGATLMVNNSLVVQVKAWCCQVTNHHLSHCWPKAMSPYCVTRSQLMHNVRDSQSHRIIVQNEFD